MKSSSLAGASGAGFGSAGFGVGDGGAQRLLPIDGGRQVALLVGRMLQQLGARLLQRPELAFQRLDLLCDNPEAPPKAQDYCRSLPQPAAPIPVPPREAHPNRAGRR